MSRLRPSFALGYHGCEREIAEKVLAGEAFEESTKDFDWLGPGAYFWESDPERALDWATQRPLSRAFKEPYVIGAVIDFGNCLDLTTREGIEALRLSYKSLKAGQDRGNLAMPVNTDLKADPHGDRLLRRLDCAVIIHMHQNIEDERAAWAAGEITDAPPSTIDTVRGMFPEGGEAFPGAGFLAKTHTQIAVRNPDCIKGVFRLRS
ncbi:MAG: hypothetical protein C0481_15390 [Phenylobacterium sp.]|uniref:hypothetical protein n=1 Tax=Phenylobacterium sp. TaxID=1871053 RepID=UPI0025FA54B5|nr:hypothetical protein [Phenylobacterium sp.]MBA4013249.1 hypothetical protein [Phenylobacterium sp.]